MTPIEGKRIMHIDTSKRFYQQGHTGIAFKIIGTGQHKGLVVSERTKRELDNSLESFNDYARHYAICIYYLIKDSLDLFDTLVICNDEDFVYVKLYLDILFLNNKIYLTKHITSLAELRRITGNIKLKSHANNYANIYRKRGLRKIQIRQKGIPLNLVKINYKMIFQLWGEIDKLIKRQ